MLEMQESCISLLHNKYKTNPMLTKKAIDKIKNSKRCKNRLAYELDKNPITITNWLRDNDIMLTTALAVKIISEETGLNEKEVLELQHA